MQNDSAEEVDIICLDDIDSEESSHEDFYKDLCKYFLEKIEAH